MSRIANSKELNVGSGWRDHGVIVTARRKGTDRLEMIHVADPDPTGDVKACLLEACDQIELMGPDWCVESISTPRTVFTDLQGMRVTHNANGTTVNAWISEIRMLSKIGKSHLLTDRCPMSDYGRPSRAEHSKRRKNLRD